MTSDTRAPEAAVPPVDERPRRLRALIILGVVAALLIWGALAAIVVVGAGADLLQARELGREGRAALLDEGDPAAARDHLAAAASSLAHAEDRLSGPVVWPLRGVPVIRPNVRAATALAAAGARAAAAGEEVAGALAELPGGLDALAPVGGTIPLEPLDDVTPALASANDLLAQARALAGSAPERGLVGPLAAARAEVVPLVEQAADAVSTATALAEVLPSFLGADEPKRYFLGASNPAELRGTGGLIGAYAVLTVDAGALSVGGFSAIHDLPGADVDDIDPPNADYAARYDRYGGAGFWQNLNLTPDFPSAARAIEALYERATGEAVDGTIVVDPRMLAGLLSLTGPAQAPGGVTVDADTVVAYVANEAYADLPDPDARKALLGQVAATAFDRFLRGDADAGAAQAVQVLGDAAGAGHLLMHATDPDVQGAFEAAGVGGALLDPEGDYLAAVVNNAAANKADFYAERSVDYAVELLPDGSAWASAAVELENNAPTGGRPEYVIGPNVADASAGENRSLLSVYCASGCRRQAFRRDLGDDHLREERELGHPVFTTMVRLAAGEAERVELDWTLDEAWERRGEGGTYLLTVQEQPALNPTMLSVQVTVPEGMVVTDAGPGWDAEGRRARFESEAGGTLTFEVDFGPAEPRSLHERVRRFLARPVF